MKKQVQQNDGQVEITLLLDAALFLLCLLRKTTEPCSPAEVPVSPSQLDSAYLDLSTE